MATPNMNLLQPTPGSAGPQWATDINNNATIIDAHDHSPGKGIPIKTSGININSDLTFSSFSAIDLRSVKFVNQTSSLAQTGARDLYIKNGDLFYANDNLDVQITNGGSVAGASGSVTGLVSPASLIFSAQQFSFFYDSSTYADLRCRDLTLSTNGGNMLKITQATTASYTLTLPSSPPSIATQLVTMSTTGVLSAPISATLGQTSSVFRWQGTTDSTTVSNGSFIIDGGVGIAKRLNVGSGLVVTGGLSILTNGLFSANNSTFAENLTVGTAPSTVFMSSGSITASGTVDCVGIRTDANFMRFRTFITNMDATGRLLYTHGLNHNFIWGVQAYILSTGGNWLDYNGYSDFLGQMIITSTRIESSGNLPILANNTVRLLIIYHN